MFELKRFILGRDFSRDTAPLSIFEKVLTTPTASDLIQMIWDKLGLHFRDEILTLVRQIPFKKKFCSQTLFNRKILTENIFSNTYLSLMTTTIC